MADQAADARLGILVQYAYDMYRAGGLTNLGPPADPRLIPEWTIRGYLTALDTVFRDFAGLLTGPLQIGGRVFYGFLAESTTSPGQFVVVIRGTDGILEWVEDGEFALVPLPGVGHVEAGFYGVYASLQFEGAPAASGIAAAVGAGSVTVVGHSLGAALATYLTLDLAGLPLLQVRGRFFASPHPGDLAFAHTFDTRVADYAAYAYVLDVVPRIPFGFGYCPLLKLIPINPKNTQARIRFDIGCNHYMLCYVSMLEYALMDIGKALATDPACANCVKGPTSLLVERMHPTR